MIVSNKEYITNSLNELIDDESAIIAYGSLKDTLFYFNNKLKKAFKCYLSDTSITSTSEVNVFSDTIININEGIYLQSYNVLLVLYNEGLFDQIPLKHNQALSMNEISLNALYRHMYISKCYRFIILFSNCEVWLFSYHLNLLLQEYQHPLTALVRGNKLEMFFVENDNIILFRPIEIAAESMLAMPENKINFDYLISTKNESWKLMKKMAIEMFVSKDLE